MFNIVEVDNEFWVNVIDLEKEYVVFYELGYCVLGRNYDDGRNGDGICSSIM